MRKVKVAAAFLCLLASGMIGGVTYSGNEMSVARTDHSDQIVEITAESVTTAASIETTAVVTTVTTSVSDTLETLKRTVQLAAPAESCVTESSEETTDTTTSATEDTASATTDASTTAASSTSATTRTTAATTRTTAATVLTTAATVPATTAAPITVTEAPQTTAAVSEGYNSEQFAVEITEREYIMLCNVVGHEYGADWVPVEEKALIAECIMNRVASPAFPNTIYDVLMQKGQFTGIEYLVKMETMSSYVTDSVREAVDLYLTHPEQFQHGYLFFTGDGYQSYFRTTY